jgi:hypothetical protein
VAEVVPRGTGSAGKVRRARRGALIAPGLDSRSGALLRFRDENHYPVTGHRRIDLGHPVQGSDFRHQAVWCHANQPVRQVVVFRASPERGSPVSALLWASRVSISVRFTAELAAGSSDQPLTDQTGPYYIYHRACHAARDALGLGSQHPPWLWLGRWLFG